MNNSQVFIISSKSSHLWLTAPKTGAFPGDYGDRWLRKHQFDPWVGKIPWRRKRHPSSVFLPGKSHWQRSLAGSMGSQRVGFNWVTEHTHTHKTIGQWLFVLNVYFLLFACFPAYLILAQIIFNLHLHWTAKAEIFKRHLLLGIPWQSSG